MQALARVWRDGQKKDCKAYLKLPLYTPNRTRRFAPIRLIPHPPAFDDKRKTTLPDVGSLNNSRHVAPDWNPASDMQALARVWRDGQKKDCKAYLERATRGLTGVKQDEAVRADQIDTTPAGFRRQEVSRSEAFLALQFRDARADPVFV
jgi:hypothetical protein